MYSLMNASALLILLRLVVGSKALSNYTYSFVLETLSYLGSVTNTFNEPDSRDRIGARRMLSSLLLPYTLCLIQQVHFYLHEPNRMSFQLSAFKCLWSKVLLVYLLDLLCHVQVLRRTQKGGVWRS